MCVCVYVYIEKELEDEVVFAGLDGVYMYLFLLVGSLCLQCLNMCIRVVCICMYRLCKDLFCCVVFDL